jgi:hypothetical protein
MFEAYPKSNVSLKSAWTLESLQDKATSLCCRFILHEKRETRADGYEHDWKMQQRARRNREDVFQKCGKAWWNKIRAHCSGISKLTSCRNASKITRVNAPWIRSQPQAPDVRALSWFLKRKPNEYYQTPERNITLRFESSLAAENTSMIAASVWMR